MRRLLRGAWERVSLYLPIALMGLLALGTYWLVRSTPVFEPPPPEQPPRHEPDYFMHRFSVRSFDAQGRLKNEISGTQARHYPDTDTLEIDQVRLRAFNERGELTTASAARAITNADGSQVELIGQALVVRAGGVDASGRATPQQSFRGDHLFADLKAERIKSDRPVELTQGTDRFTADRLDFDQSDRTLQLQGRVRGSFQSRP